MRIGRWIENALLLTGLVAVNCWIWANASNAVYQGWENWVFDREVRHEPATLGRFLEEKRDQLGDIVARWSGHGAAPEPETVPSPVLPHAAPPLIQSDSVIGRLTIPRLRLSAMVREGAGEDTLRVALGHIPDTALPGQPGNVGIAGHRDKLFRNLRNIRENDVIVLETLAGKYVYRVNSTSVVDPRNVGVLRAGQHSELTLVTCYPFYYVGSAPDRFIVKARQVSSSPQPVAKS